MLTIEQILETLQHEQEVDLGAIPDHLLDEYEELLASTEGLEDMIAIVGREMGRTKRALKQIILCVGEKMNLPDPREMYEKGLETFFSRRGKQGHVTVRFKAPQPIEPLPPAQGELPIGEPGVGDSEAGGQPE